MVYVPPGATAWQRWTMCCLILLSLFGCQRGVPPPALSPPVPPAFWLSRTGPLPLLDDLDQESLRQALQRSLEYARRLPPDRPLAFGDTQIPASRLLQTLEAFQQALSLSPTPEALQRTLQERFEVVQSPGRDAQGDVLFTGYYEIELEGSPVASVQFPYPVYKRPPDLADTEAARSASGRVYYTRREIDVEGRLRGRGLELYWLRNPVDGFFLHVQGSGQIRLPDGRIQRVSYAASNGHPYTSIGRILLDEGRIPRAAMSLQGLRRYFRERPEEVTRVLYQNARYVFFRPVAHAPQGNLGVTLVPGRSIATDQRVFPAGGVAFVQMQQPVWNAEGTILTWKPATRFVFNHDTGSAITGPGRVDLFWGNGAKAEVAAGHMQHSGQLFFLLKRTP